MIIFLIFLTKREMNKIKIKKLGYLNLRIPFGPARDASVSMAISLLELRASIIGGLIRNKAYE